MLYSSGPYLPVNEKLFRQCFTLFFGGFGTWGFIWDYSHRLLSLHFLPRTYWETVTVYTRNSLSLTSQTQNSTFDLLCWLTSVKMEFLSSIERDPTQDGVLWSGWNGKDWYLNLCQILCYFPYFSVGISWYEGFRTRTRVDGKPSWRVESLSLVLGPGRLNVLEFPSGPSVYRLVL